MNRLEELLLVWHEGELDSEQTGELKAALRVREGRAALFEHFFMTAAVAEALKMQKESVAEPKPKRRLISFRVWAAAAAVILAFGVRLSIRVPEAPKPAPVIEGARVAVVAGRTTGSVIYTGEDCLKRLRRYTTIVHFSTPPEVQDQMLRAYLANQRPVLWREFFDKSPNETFEESMARCYPRLLRSREASYRQYADVTIEYNRRRQKGFGVSDFLKAVGGGEA